MYSVAQQRVDRLRVEVEGGFAYHVEPFVHIVTRTSLRDGLAGEGIVLICVHDYSSALEIFSSNQKIVNFI